MIPFADLILAQPPAQCAPANAADGSDDDWEHDEHGCRTTKKSKHWERGSIFGVRLAVTNTNGAEKDGTFVGASLFAGSEQFSVGKIFSGHSSSYGFIGGGSAGFEGGLGGTLMVGARVPFGTTHGPLARIGLGGEMLGNKRLYYSRLVLPVAEIGYQYAADHTILELGGRGGNVISGRYNTGHRTRRELGDGSFEWGFYAAAHTAHSRFDLSYARIQADDNYPGGAVDTLRGMGCAYLGAVGICGDAMVINGKGYIGLPRVPLDVTTIYAGITVGFIDR